ncbi:MFS transporter [Streptomyces flaveolus]|uniref:MFS transporter n=1 Tax=Streptomyces flaveolus TaxID=67297 RepID=UPI003F54FB63
MRRLLAATAASQLGTQLGLLTLPLVAVMGLGASTFEASALTAAQTAAFLLLGLPVGAWADRLRRLPLMVGADLLRAAALASVAVAVWSGALGMSQLYVVAFVTGTAAVFFDVADQSFLPRLLPRHALVAGNGALEAVRSVAQLTGSGLGGLLVQALGSALAAADCAAYLVSAVILRRIPVREPEVTTHRPPLRAQIAEGLSFVLRHPILRAIALTTGWANLCGVATTSVLTPYLVRDLGLRPVLVGLVVSLSAAGGTAGALCAGRLTRAVGLSRVILLSSGVTGTLALLWPLSGYGGGAWCFAAGSAGVSFASCVYNIAQVSMRQALCPPELMGRMNATLRLVVWGVLPLGGLLGGAVASVAGTRATLWCSALGLLLMPLPLLASPLRTERAAPPPAAVRAAAWAPAPTPGTAAPGFVARRLPPSAARSDGGIGPDRLVPILQRERHAVQSLSITAQYRRDVERLAQRFPDSGTLPLTGAQRRFLLSRQLTGRCDLLPLYFALPTGLLDLPRLRAAAEHLSAVHPALHHQYGMTRGVPVQTHTAPRAEVRRLGLPLGATWSDAVRPVLAAWPAEGPALRLYVVEPEPQGRHRPGGTPDTVLAIVLDHAAGDEESLGRLLADLSAAYRQGLGPSDADPVTTRRELDAYREAVHRQVTVEIRASAEQHLAYWGARLAGVRHGGVPPADPATPEGVGSAQVRLAVDGARRDGLFPTLLAGCRAAAGALPGAAAAPVLGYPWGGRPGGTAPVLGSFLNLVAYTGPRSDHGAADTAPLWWDDVDHADTPFDEVVRAARGAGASWSGAFDAMLTLEDLTRRPELRLGGTEAQELHVDVGPLFAPLMVSCSYGDDLLVRMKWNSRLVSDGAAAEALTELACAVGTAARGRADPTG